MYVYLAKLVYVRVDNYDLYVVHVYMCCRQMEKQAND